VLLRCRIAIDVSEPLAHQILARTPLATMIWLRGLK